ncbi:Alcohol dehydrogenase superfamily zinc-containing [Macrophomina phaseolina MS6]|uniref:Alcohol dehydrogenase superfamily zinc-containing n=1 Tax=Macrophomina phaseolina (strain MS6) TaxID=1126212 RepID=K2SCM4_MACPH|nr:Alcohol dehydrogenase superfamily zinc-containing [Macrophomina phaseolina MS6]
MFSAWQVWSESISNWRAPEAVEHLQLNEGLPIPARAGLRPNQVLVRIRAASVNARDIMVIANDLKVPLKTARNLTPCADGAGEIGFAGQSTGLEEGQKVIITPGAWEAGSDTPSLEAFQGKGAGSAQGTLRQYAVLVSRLSTLSRFEMS